MVRRTMRNMCAGAVVALIAAGAAAAPAHGSIGTAHGYKYPAKSFQISPGKVKTFKVMCPDGLHVYGGGQNNSGSFNKIAQLQGFPIDGKDRDKKPDDGYAVILANRTTDPMSLTVTASCGKPKANYPYVKSTMFPNGASQEVDADCTKVNNTSLVGGGVQGPRGVVQEDGGPDGVGNNPHYYAYMENTSGKKKTAKVYAICAKIDTQYTSNSAQIFGMTEAFATAECPAGTAVLDGGMGSTGGVSLNASFHDGAYDSWTVLGDNLTNSQRMIVSFATCGKHP